MEEAQDLTHASVLAPVAMALPSLPGARLSEDRVATELGEEIRSPDECGSPIGSGDQETNKTYMEIRLITNFTSPTVASPVFKTDEEGAAFLLEKNMQSDQNKTRQSHCGGRIAQTLRRSSFHWNSRRKTKKVL